MFFFSLVTRENNQQKDWEENKLEEKFIHLTRPLSLVIENMETIPSCNIIPLVLLRICVYNASD